MLESTNSQPVEENKTVYSHADCPVCNGDPDAIARQEYIMDHSLSAKVLDYAIDQLDTALPNLVFGSGKHNDNIHFKIRRSETGGRHLAPKSPSRIHESLNKLQFQPRTAVAASLIVSTALTTAAPLAKAETPPIPAIAPADLDASQLLPYDFSPEAVISHRLITTARPETAEADVIRVVPTEQMTVQPAATQVEAEPEITQPLVRTLFPGQTIRDFVNLVAGDLPRAERVEMIERIAELSEVDLETGEDRNLRVGYELKMPIDISSLDPARDLYTVKKGDTSAQLYAKLGFKEEGYSFDEFLQHQAIVDKDSIRTGWKMLMPSAVENVKNQLTASAPIPAEPVPPASPDEPIPAVPPTRKPEMAAPEQLPKSPQLIVGPPSDQLLADITHRLQEQALDAGQIAFDNDQIALENGRYASRAEAGEGLNLLIKAVRDYENPLHDLPVPPIEQEPTPEADRLRADWNELVDEIVNGETNLAYVQSEALRRLATGPDNQVNRELMLGIADHFVRFVAEQNGWVVIEEEVASLAELMVRGAMPVDLTGNSHARLEAASLADKLNHSSLTLDLYQVSLQAHLEEQVELARLAEQQLELLRSNMRDLSEDELSAIAQAMISAKRNGQPVNDYSYEVFQAKLGEQANESAVLKLLGRQLYASRQSDDLLELFPSIETGLSKIVDDWLVAEGEKSLSGLIDTISLQLNEQITSITERGAQLQELELDLEELDPTLIDLNSIQLYELAKTILSAEENGQRVGDDWFYLIELKAPTGEELDQTLLNLIAGVYRVQGADSLLAMSGQEQEAVANAIEQFQANPERNVKEFLDGQFGSLEQRLSGAEAEISAIIEAVGNILPELSIKDYELSAMPIQRLLGQTDQELVDQIIESFEDKTGRNLTSEETARIGVEIIKLQNPDQDARLNKLAQHLFDFYNENNANYYLDGAADPAIATLSLMLEEGKHVINYAEGDVSIFSEAFMDKLRAYNTIPSSLFPGTQWLIKGYAGQDLRPYFEHLGLDADAILANPYNDRLKLTDGRITADANGAIWFDADLWAGGNAPDFEAAADYVYGEIPGFKYTVKEGQTYAGIAQMFRVNGEVPDWKEMVEWNRGRIPSDPTKLSIGTEIAIPQGWEVHISGLEDRASAEINPNAASGGSGIQDTRNALANNARTQLERDVVEDAGRNRDSRGIIAHYCNGQDKQWEWCACFASTMLKDSGIDVEGRYGHVEPGALRLMELLRDDRRFEFLNPDEIDNNTDLMPGDLVFYTRGGGKGHVGIVDYVKDAGLAVTIDGNMGDKLAERRLDVAGHERFVGVIRYIGEPQSEPKPEPAPKPEPKPAAEEPSPPAAEQPTQSQSEEVPQQEPAPESENRVEQNDFPVMERYEPGSEEFVELFTAAAEELGLPAEWATSDGLENLVQRESGGWVGIPNYTYEERKKDRDQWDDIHEELRRGEITARASATGLGQLLLDNVESHYPSGAEGIGDPLEEAIGMLSYIEQRYGDPDTAWGNHGANPDRWSEENRVYKGDHGY